MPDITFRFTDATASGDDVGAGELIRCSPAVVEFGDDAVRSTRAFAVSIVDGDAVATLEPGVWRIEVVGVQGFAERWVRVLDEDALFVDLEVVDPATIEGGGDA